MFLFCLFLNFNNIFFVKYTYQISANGKIISACSCHRKQDCCGEWEGWDPVYWFNQTSWLAIVTPTDRHKSVGTRCVIEVFGGVFVLSLCVLNFYAGGRAFVIGLSQTFSFFSYSVIVHKFNY